MVIGIILLIPLFFAVKSLARPQASNRTAAQAQVTGTPNSVPTGAAVAPSAGTEPTAVPVVAQGKQPPACTFPLAQIPVVESRPENYTFSEPKVVLTAPKGNVYSLIEWLPDNQQVLMTEDLRNNYVYRNDNAPQQSISLYTPETGESKLYAIRVESQEPPSWEPELNAVVYPAINYTRIDNYKGVYEFSRQVRISYGNSGQAQLLADNLSQLPLAIKPGGSAMVYFSNTKISKLNASLKSNISIPFDGSSWDYAAARRNQHPVSFNLAWQPGTSMIFIYSEGAMGGGGYTFILDADTGSVCELTLKGWAKVPRWSSDGRYLAFIRVENYAFLYPKSDLALLDTTTGKLTVLSVISPEIAGQSYIDDFVWAPDNRHLLAIGSINSHQNSEVEGITQDLYFIDYVSGQVVSIFPELTLNANSPQSLAWSPDGSKLLIRCPTKVIDELCFITVQGLAK